MSNRDDEIVEVMARAWVREEAAQMGEPDPWPESTDELGDRAAISDWRGCASAQLEALRAAGMEVVPAEPIEAQVDAFFNQLKRMPEFGLVTREKVRAGYRAMLATHTAREPRADTAPEPIERGPWRAGGDSETGRAWIDSDDFHHDVRLYINGDFACYQHRQQYARMIADRLNTANLADSAPDGEGEG